MNKIFILTFALSFANLTFGMANRDFNILYESEDNKFFEQSNNVLKRSSINFYKDNQNGETNLHLAAVINPELIKELVARGADINCKDNDGCTPLHYAIYHNNRESVKVLMGLGADVYATDNKGHNLRDYIKAFMPDYNQSSVINNPSSKSIYSTEPINYAKYLVLAGLIAFDIIGITYITNKNFEKKVNQALNKIKKTVRQNKKKAAAGLSATAAVLGYLYFRK